MLRASRSGFAAAGAGNPLESASADFAEGGKLRDAADIGEVVALARLGCEQVPLLPSYGPREREFMLEESRPANLLAWEDDEAGNGPDLHGQLPTNDPSLLPPFEAPSGSPLSPTTPWSRSIRRSTDSSRNSIAIATSPRPSSRLEFWQTKENHRNP